MNIEYIKTYIRKSTRFEPPLRHVTNPLNDYVVAKRAESASHRHTRHERRHPPQSYGSPVTKLLSAFLSMGAGGVRRPLGASPKLSMALGLTAA